MKTTGKKLPRVFIAGGAGFLGINLIRFLLEKKYDIVSYDIAPFCFLESKDITVVKNDIRRPTPLKKAMQGSDVVIHCAAAQSSDEEKNIFSTSVKGTENILKIAEELGTKRVIYVSSASVYDPNNSSPIRETNPLGGTGADAQAKIKAEAICQQYRDHGMCVTILRPQAMVGPEKTRVFPLIFDWAKDRRNFPVIGRGDNQYQLLDVEDFCEVIYTVMTGSKAKVNSTFNVGARVFKTMKEDFQAVLDYAGFGKRVITFPWVSKTLVKDSVVSIEKAESKLDFSPRFSNKAALIRGYQWYLKKHPTLRSAKWALNKISWRQILIGTARLFF
jgi:nucleoside-diphosphate-sugar epimerase